MQTIRVSYRPLGFDEAKNYWMAGLFILGNIVLPQLCHLVPQGGLRWLPIYFFTLIGACKYGWRVGLLTAVVSPLLNTVLFGMPAVAGLPAILLKSTLLALIAGMLSERCERVTLGLLVVTVLGYQVLGSLGEWALKGSLFAAVQDFRIGLPGMLVQVFGGWLLLTARGRNRFRPTDDNEPTA